MSDAPVARIAGVLLLLVLPACGPQRPPEGIAGPDLFAWAQERFDEGDYRSARNGFQAFLLTEPLSSLTDSAQFMGAESQLRFGDDLPAAEEFARLATGRPNSPWADDAQLGVCRAYMAAAPKISLSQEYAERAIVECERVGQFFPASDLREAAQKMVAAAQSKLAEKSLTVGEYYFKRRFYGSANVYFEKAISEHPGPDILPQLLEFMVRSYGKIGFDTEARAMRDRLLEEFPDSKEAARVRDSGGDAS